MNSKRRNGISEVPVYLNSLQTPFEKIEIRQDEVKETVRKLKTKVNKLNSRTERIEMMLNAIVNRMSIQVNEDEIDEDND